MNRPRWHLRYTLYFSAAWKKIVQVKAKNVPKVKRVPGITSRRRPQLGERSRGFIGPFLILQLDVLKKRWMTELAVNHCNYGHFIVLYTEQA